MSDFILWVYPADSHTGEHTHFALNPLLPYWHPESLACISNLACSCTHWTLLALRQPLKINTGALPVAHCVGCCCVLAPRSPEHKPSRRWSLWPTRIRNIGRVYSTAKAGEKCSLCWFLSLCMCLHSPEAWACLCHSPRQCNATSVISDRFPHAHICPAVSTLICD